jgi:hypothetical protein
MKWTAITTPFRERLGKIWLGFAFILVAVLGFEAGLLKRSLGEIAPLIVAAPSPVPAPVNPVRATVSQMSETVASNPPTNPSADCAFVGSKKSNKYHAPTSRCAKQIKSENRLCFASVDAAKAKGYLPGCLE